MHRGKERRHLVRYKAGKLSVSVLPYDCQDRFRKPDRVNSFDYNRSGLGFRCQDDYQVGDLLVFTFSLEGEHVSGVVGQIRHCGNGRCGVLFDFGVNEHMGSSEVLDALEAIESMLNRSHASVVSSALRKVKKKERYGS